MCCGPGWEQPARKLREGGLSADPPPGIVGKVAVEGVILQKPGSESCASLDVPSCGGAEDSIGSLRSSPVQGGSSSGTFLAIRIVPAPRHAPSVQRTAMGGSILSQKCGRRVPSRIRTKRNPKAAPAIMPQRAERFDGFCCGAGCVKLLGNSREMPVEHRPTAANVCRNALGLTRASLLR